MDLGLRDKIVLVTGGAKGIGAATVKAFLAEDCKVVIVDRDTEAASVLAKS
jgi:3-oxoacyl-[acyl-carrier protein] reductase